MSKSLRVAWAGSLICFVASAAALVAGVGVPADPTPLRFDPDPFVIPAALAQLGESDVQIDVVNDADIPARIVGVEEFCSSVCFYGRALPLEVPARGRAQLTLHLKARLRGAIAEEVTFFTDRPTQPRLTMRVVGDIPELPTHEPGAQASNP